MDFTRFDDETLLRLMAQSKVEALSELYDRYSRFIFGLAMQMLREEGAAEEATQDTFLRAWENAASYQAEKSKASTWLARIVRNRSIDMLRQRKARRENNLFSIDEIPGFALVDKQGVEEQVDLRRQQQRVRNALAQLPSDQLEPLVMAYYRGMTQDQIAQALGEPLGTIKTRIRLAMQKLRRKLQKEIPDIEQG